MTQNQLIQEYEFDPTLTTRELSAAQEKAVLDQFAHAMDAYDYYFDGIDEVKAVAERFDYNVEAFVESCKKAIEESRRYLRDLETRICAKFEAFIADSTVALAKDIIEDVSAYSDVYKDEYGIRPHYRWECYWARLSDSQKAVYKEAMDELIA